MEKELIELFRGVKKVADIAAASGGVGSSMEEEQCLDALKQLKQFPITRDVLISTKIGKNLRPLTKHPRKRIQAMASDVFEMWMGIFRQESHDDNNNGDHTISSKKERSKSDDTKKHGIKLKLVSASRIMQPTNDKNRNKIRELVAEALCKVASEVDDQNLLEEANKCNPYHVAATVETELFRNWGLSNGDKKAKYRSFMFNINDAKNPDFRRKVLLGYFSPASIVELSSEDMASDARKLENMKIREKFMFDCERVESAQASTMEMKCAKCKKSQTTYHQMQTRRADEPMTTFVRCLNCNHHWRFS